MVDAVNKPRPSHELRFSWETSTYDYVCDKCCNTDKVPGDWGKLIEPCQDTTKENQPTE